MRIGPTPKPRHRFLCAPLILVAAQVAPFSADSPRAIDAGARARSVAGTEGEITIVLGGESETLPVSGGEWDPTSRDDPEFGDSGLVRFHIKSGLKTQPDRLSGDPVSEIIVTFNESTFEVVRGQNSVHDHRVTSPEVENYLAAFDTPADSDLEFTIEEYEARGGSGFVRGRFSGTDIHQGRSLTGTFSALVPGAPCRKSVGSYAEGNQRVIEGRMTAEGCVFP